MFRTFVEEPVFNLLELIYAVLPAHDLGIAIIIFTAIIRLLLWPLVRKQLHHARAMRKLQPELKKLKKAAAGDRQKEARLQMELYKEHEVKPFATIGTLIIQIPIFIALYQVIIKLIKDPNILNTYGYEPIRNLSWIREVLADIQKFDVSFLGTFDLSRTGISSEGIYIGAIILALASSIMQYYQSKLMMRDHKDARKLMDILKEATAGKQADQTEVTAAISRGMLYFLPFITFVFAINIPSALSLYFFTSSAVGYLQQWYVFKQDKEEMHEIASEEPKKELSPKKTKKKSSKKPAKKRRK